jgi:hypothetical protein
MWNPWSDKAAAEFDAIGINGFLQILIKHGLAVENRNNPNRPAFSPSNSYGAPPCQQDAQKTQANKQKENGFQFVSLPKQFAGTPSECHRGALPRRLSPSRRRDNLAIGVKGQMLDILHWRFLR